MLPNGIWASCFGASQRHNDLGMLSLLVLPDQLISYFIELGIRLGDGELFPALYGDSIFQHTLMICCKIADGQKHSEEGSSIVE